MERQVFFGYGVTSVLENVINDDKGKLLNLILKHQLKVKVVPKYWRGANLTPPFRSSDLKGCASYTNVLPSVMACHMQLLSILPQTAVLIVTKMHVNDEWSVGDQLATPTKTVPISLP